MFIEENVNELSLLRRGFVYGVGINDAWYKTVNNNEVCPYYAKWKEMLARSYSEVLKTRNPSYRNCSACDEWHVFSSFRKWMEKQDWQGKELDKDVVNPGNKLYSPENCAFVDHYTNSLLNIKRTDNGELPPGVTKVSKGPGYIARIRLGSTRKYLGYFRTINEASNTYILAKIRSILKCSNNQSDIRAARGLIKHAQILSLGITAE